MKEDKIVIRVRRDDWHKYLGCCSQFGHGDGEELLKLTADDYLAGNEYRDLTLTDEDYTKYSTSYWSLLERQWNYLVEVSLAVSLGIWLLRFAGYQGSSLRSLALYSAIASLVSVLVLKEFSSGLSANRTSAAIPQNPRWGRRVELLWFMPFCLLALSLALTFFLFVFANAEF